MSLHRPALLAATLAFLLSLTLSAWAEESYVAYPPLPSGYTSIKVFDRHGRYAGRILPEGRHWVTLDRIPAFLQNAVVAIEDARFYEHGGIDLRGIARAVVSNIAKGRLAEGGSTITQQLVKNKHLSAEKTIDRKVHEGLLAMEYEKKYTKQQILEMYFNEIYFGNGAWGIAQAARQYFDKNPEELTDAESAVLAGVPKNPGRYNPLGKPADVEQRRNTVLARMVELEKITSRQEQVLRSQKLTVSKPGETPQYLAHVHRKLVEWYGPQVIDQGGLEITVAMDLELQKQAEKMLREGVQKIAPELQGALLCLDPQTGDVLAAAGGVDFPKSTYNRAFFAQRQPGSAIKPLIYAAALEQGATASSRWDDLPVSYDRGNHQKWTPRNYRGEAFGTLTLREALAHSNNVITVKLLDAIGVPYFVDFAQRLGLPLRTPNDLSLALGTDEVTLHSLALAYTPLATGGVLPKARTVLRIHDSRDGAWTVIPQEGTAVLSPAAAYITTRMLQDVMTVGTARSLKKFAGERPAAGKTGTTDDYRDAWFVGYTPQLITGVWVGHDTPKPGGKGFTGGAIAAPIWERFMRQALAAQPIVDFPQPETVVAVAIDPKTGYLATEGCPEFQEEFYLSGTEPAAYCPEHPGTPVEFLTTTPSPETGSGNAP
ncbi:MAG: PBP1A family penicillin-binding protein [Desulfuromonadales bacterium]|nr:PBP1A family penicillin-binding protein [Desulfuromonadales bacterium]